MRSTSASCFVLSVTPTIHAQEIKGTVRLSADFRGRLVSQTFSGWIKADHVDRSLSFVTNEPYLLHPCEVRLGNGRPMYMCANEGEAALYGLGGIQARHYDRHDYMPERRAALEQWSRRFRNAACSHPTKTTRVRDAPQLADCRLRLPWPVRTIGVAERQENGTAHPQEMCRHP